VGNSSRRGRPTSTGATPNVATSWLWELWNEPDNSYWHGTFAEYAKLYDYTEAAIHGVLPTAQLGGRRGGERKQLLCVPLLQHCATGSNAVTARRAPRLDLISSTPRVASTVTGGHVEMNLGHQLSLHQTGFKTGDAWCGVQSRHLSTSPRPIPMVAPLARDIDAGRCISLLASYGTYEIAMMKHTLELEASMV